MKNLIFILTILMSLSAIAQDEKLQTQDSQEKKLMIKQIQIIKSIGSKLKKLLK